MSKENVFKKLVASLPTDARAATIVEIESEIKDLQEVLAILRSDAIAKIESNERTQLVHEPVTPPPAAPAATLVAVPKTEHPPKRTAPKEAVVATTPPEQTRLALDVRVQKNKKENAHFTFRFRGLTRKIYNLLKDSPRTLTEDEVIRQLAPVFEVNLKKTDHEDTIEFPKTVRQMMHKHSLNYPGSKGNKALYFDCFEDKGIWYYDLNNKETAVPRG